MPSQYPPALREQIVLEYRQGRSIRALANDYDPAKRRSGIGLNLNRIHDLTSRKRTN